MDFLNNFQQLIYPHGNFGSVDGDGAAAMRYTEARLSKISMEMLADINKDTVDYAPNIDETEKEPVVMPARYPNLLVNGTSGIAVGMATNIPPHNLREVVSARHAGRVRAASRAAGPGHLAAVRRLPRRRPGA